MDDKESGYYSMGVVRLSLLYNHVSQPVTMLTYSLKLPFHQSYLPYMQHCMYMVPQSWLEEQLYCSSTTPLLVLKRQLYIL